MPVHEYIEIKVDKRFGHPCIVNTRISVNDILLWLASGMTFHEIIQEYPELNEEHIKAASAFAADRENHLRTAS